MNNIASITKTDLPAYIILGASGEIGTEIANRLSKKENEGKMFFTHSPFNKNNSSKDYKLDKSLWYELDVTDVDSVNQFATSVEKLSKGPLKIVYCVGLLDDHPISLVSDESWSKILNTNLTGAFHIIRRFYKTISVRRNGRLVFIGSVASRKASVGQSAYSASKAGLEALCRVVALELGRFSSTCNVVAPGGIISSMVRQTNPLIIDKVIHNTPLRKLGGVADIAAIVEFLFSEESKHITGQTIFVDGGISSV